MSAATTLQFPVNETPNAMPVAPSSNAAEPVYPGQYAVTENAAVPAPQDGRRGRRGQRQPINIVAAPYTPAPKPAKVRKQRQPRGVDLSGLEGIEPGIGIYITGVKEGTVRQRLREYKKANQLAFTPGVDVMQDGTVIVYRPLEG